MHCPHSIHGHAIYLCVCMHVCVLNSVEVFHHPEPFDCSGSPRKKVLFNDFTVFPAVAEPSSNISYCMYCRIKWISIKKELQQEIARLFGACNIKRKGNWIFLDFLEMEQHYCGNFPGKQCNCGILEEIISVWIVEVNTRYWNDKHQDLTSKGMRAHLHWKLLSLFSLATAKSSIL